LTRVRWLGGSKRDGGGWTVGICPDRLGSGSGGAPPYRTRFSKHQFTPPQLLAILCLMRYEDWTFREAEVRLGEHRELRQALGLARVPDFTTVYRFLQRLEGQTLEGGDAAVAGELGWPSTRPAWRREQSARSLCGACISTGKNPCRGGIG